MSRLGYTRYVAQGGDCNDADGAWRPGAPESCEDPNDYNCDGSVGYADGDLDNFPACEDCDDGDVAINPDALAAAMKDIFAGAKPQLTDEEVQQVMQDFQKKMMAKQMAAREEGLAKNKGEGEKFLAENKKKEGVKTTASGLQYKVIKDGTGKTPKATDTVKTHYRGTLINGTEFDSSYKRGEPAEFPVNGVIKGWTEALQLMKEGAKWQLFIPSNLAYGERGAGQAIGPNATLIFDIELLDIEAAK